MSYKNLHACLEDLEAAGALKRVDAQVSADQEVAAIQRRAFRAGGPALLFTRVAGTRFPMLANLYGTRRRVRYIFRHSMRAVEAIVRAKADPAFILDRPWELARALPALSRCLPARVQDGPILKGRCSILDLPLLKSWPKDGGGYVTLPQVYSEDPEAPGFKRSNLGMYRVQLSGGDYVVNEEVGLHYQIHRGIGPHHAKALAKGEALPVNIFVGGPPSLALAAVMPLPEGLPELYFAGLLGGRRLAMVCREGVLPFPAEADFLIQGEITGALKPEGPFGDHLGYYSLAHDFPVLRVKAVRHRPDAVWPFTTVGRPPQEDTVFGDFIHELTGPLLPTVFAGVRQVHAVDAAGVHPLMLAVGSERYVPFAAERMPQELLTNAMALLGSTQTSLTKFLLIAAQEDAPGLDARDIPGFFEHMLRRMDFSRDLHFVTRTTMDTLDYTGISLNQGSKCVWAAAGPARHDLCEALPEALGAPDGLPDKFNDPVFFAPGICVLKGPRHRRGRDRPDPLLEGLGEHLGKLDRGRKPGRLAGLRLVVVADDAAFAARNWDNFLWVVFTRADPATDTYGAGAFAHAKHWGCAGPLILDARLKSYHAPPLEEDPAVVKRVEAMAAKGGPLEGVF